jgi:formylglycine-generating enzyme required for sulfatase activity
MSASRRKQEEHQKAITAKTPAQSKDTHLQKGPPPRKRSLFSFRSTTSRSTKLSVVGKRFFALPFIALLVIGLFVAALVWEAYGGSPLTTWFLSPLEPPAETHDPLPINEARAPGAVPAGMVWIPGGWFWMGTDDESHSVANPIHKVYVDGFWMAKYETTNAEWAAFVEATDYKTYCELRPDPKDFPDVPAVEIRKKGPFSLVFTPPQHRVTRLDDHRQWWDVVEGANWRHPEGPESTIKGKEKHPVVHIAWVDTITFLKWKNQQHPPKKGWEYRLPTEAEWEFAARGGKNLCKFTWGNELKPGGKWMANIWQGQFPHKNTKEDGYILTAPVGSYPANGFGLHDMAGNVWEWCFDWYNDNYYSHSPERNPTGPARGYDPLEPGLPKKVQRGGSFLCDASYCERYLVYARGKGDINSAANHIGFRYVLAPQLSSKY